MNNEQEWLFYSSYDTLFLKKGVRCQVSGVRLKKNLKVYKLLLKIHFSLFPFPFSLH